MLEIGEHDKRHKPARQLETSVSPDMTLHPAERSDLEDSVGLQVYSVCIGLAAVAASWAGAVLTLGSMCKRLRLLAMTLQTEILYHTFMFSTRA